MPEINKGAATAHSHTTRGSDDHSCNKIQSYHNTLRSVCLMLITIGMVLIYIGAYVDISLISIFGIGIGGSAGLISVKMNIEEEY